MKIAVTGFSGSGKSTLARTIGQKLNIPVLHLDRVHWLPGWVENEPDQARQQVARFMDQPAWVIDGNYSRYHYEERMEQADLIVFLNFNRWQCLYRVIKRYLRYRNRTRSDMTQGCNEKIDPEFIRWILWEGRTKRFLDRRDRLIRRYEDKVVVLSDQQQIDGWWAAFDGS
ncbi:MAG TPA: DNA topology modulation protein FlaR [Tissierellia bacterium]|nr:DNA topology modulation protein FlaR [Tissierellia bacterium]